ncbi:MAG: DUF2155 domain-containing protein [Alphaproteobacteria bacterium]|nr:DUF2155 domain-containing protein [Alphaproteobacteria bacterium]
MKINNKYILSAMLSILTISSAYSKEITTNAALMQSMDKLTGRVKKITVPVNSQIKYGDFSLVLRACKKNPPEETPENFAFVDVTDKSLGDEEYNIFRGWMLSSAPGINAIEHPIYDVWLLECIDTDISTTPLLSKQELERRDSLPTKEFVISNQQEEIREVVVSDDIENKTKKAIHIKSFISGDRDIEENIKINSAPSSSSLKQEEANMNDTPQNLLNFAKDEVVKDVEIKQED